MVIPAMDVIDTMIATTSETLHNVCVAVCATLIVGAMTLNRYYKKTDNSELYHISMGVFHS
jgi:hypothetical protein